MKLIYYHSNHSLMTISVNNKWKKQMNSSHGSRLSSVDNFFFFRFRHWTVIKKYYAFHKNKLATAEKRFMVSLLRWSDATNKSTIIMIKLILLTLIKFTFNSLIFNIVKQRRGRYSQERINYVKAMWNIADDQC